MLNAILYAMLFPLSLTACATIVSKPCATGGEPPRSTPFKGTKQCIQRKDPAGRYLNDGKYVEWYPNGNLALQGEYKMGRKTGKWMEWDIDGKKISERWFEDGQEQKPTRPVVGVEMIRNANGF